MIERDDRSIDESTLGGGGRFDDDRLMAYVLGLDGDPELETAVTSDEALRARVAALRDEIAAVGAGLSRVVPPPPDDYTDLGEERWRRLRELLATPAPAVSDRRPLWRRALAPAIALGLVLVLGVAGIQYLGGGEGTELATENATDKAAESYGDAAASDQDASLGRAASEDGDGRATAQVREIAGATSYAAVVVARAAPPGGSSQRFEVVRILRQDDADVEVGDLVELGIIDQTVEPDRLVVLFLDPSPIPDPSGTAGAPTVATTEGGGPGVVEYGHHGARALILLLEAGTDPGALSLP